MLILSGRTIIALLSDERLSWKYGANFVFAAHTIANKAARHFADESQQAQNIPPVILVVSKNSEELLSGSNVKESRRIGCLTQCGDQN